MIEVIKAGLLSSIQDLGRPGFRKYGIPVSGAMDNFSAKLGNCIVGNSLKAASLEITLQGPELRFNKEKIIALTGADLSPTLNGGTVNMNALINVSEGDVLAFGRRKVGVRSYLAVKGGFKSNVKFGSLSYFEGITKKSTIEKGDSLEIGDYLDDSSLIELELFMDEMVLEAFPGPEYELLTELQKKMLTQKDFTIGLNNRMGYQLSEIIPNDLEGIISSAVLPGTVQLTPKGQLIVLMRDCQTTGGYPRILQLTKKSINILSQKMQNEQIQFSIQHI